MSEENAIRDRVAKALEKIRPYLQSDGGDISLVDITEDKTVKVRLQGACHGCPFSMQTLKAGVEQALINEVPEVRKVVAVE
jgi:Fe-S cluster biogenesis protein NfuA